MGKQIEKTNFSMSIKFLFVFSLFVVAALSVPVKREHKVEAIGDLTDTKVEKTENGINVKASSAGKNDPISVSRSGKCWDFHVKGGNHAKSHASGCTSHSSEFKWEPVELLLDVTDNLTLSSGGERVTPL